ncbi:MAG: DNA/RNA non-specific endonuclease [Bacteroidota bacterium]
MANRKSKVGLAGQFGILAAGIGILAFVYTQFFGGELPTNLEPDTSPETEEPLPADPEAIPEGLPALTDYLDLLPQSDEGTTIQHEHFALSYMESHELAQWVAYELDIPRLNEDLDRTNNFRQDRAIPSGSAAVEDYRGSGFDRGHLVPAADMAYHPDAMSRSFLLSNISPQDRSFNRGIWRELEEQVRDWTRASKHLFIITGPVLEDNPTNWIGRKNKIAVPQQFYKVLLDYQEPELKAIGFLLPNEKSNLSLDQFAVPVDEIEKATGLDFFAALPDDLEDQLEANFNPFRWQYDAERYRKRVEVWNNQ